MNLSPTFIPISVALLLSISCPLTHLPVLVGASAAGSDVKLIVPAFFEPEDSAWQSYIVPQASTCEACAGIIAIQPGFVNGAGMYMDGTVGETAMAERLQEIRNSAPKWKVAGVLGLLFGSRSMEVLMAEVNYILNLFPDLDAIILGDPSPDDSHTISVVETIHASYPNVGCMLFTDVIPTTDIIQVFEVVVSFIGNWRYLHGNVGGTALDSPSYDGQADLGIMAYSVMNDADIKNVRAYLDTLPSLSYVYLSPRSDSYDMGTLTGFDFQTIFAVLNTPIVRRRGVYLSLQTDRAGSLDYSSDPLYDQFTNILGNERKEGVVLQFLKDHDFNAISLYNMGNILPSMEQELRAFMEKARKMGITTVEGIGGQSLSFTWDKMVAFHEASFATHSSPENFLFDGFLTEIEYWNDPALDVGALLAPIQYMKGLTLSTYPSYAAYLGWPSASDMAAMVQDLDSIFLHVYRTTPDSAVSYASDRISYIRQTFVPVDIVPIFAATGSKYKPGSEVFMGEWLASNSKSIDEAEGLFLKNFREDFSTMMGQLTGFQWFSYAFLKLYLDEGVGRHMTEPRFLQLAQEVVLMLDNAAEGQNVYGTNPSFIDMTAKTARTQCSTFLTALLKLAYEWDESKMYELFRSTSPFASTYYNFIQRNEHFTRVWNITDVRPGDIVATLYEPEASVTGHIMIIRAVVPRNESFPIVPNTNQWEAVVIDSSSSYHGPTDTRNAGAQGGIGMGVARLYSDKNTGIIVGYTWSLYSNSIYYGLGNRTVVVGRPMFVPDTLPSPPVPPTTTQTPTSSGSTSFGATPSLSNEILSPSATHRTTISISHPIDFVPDSTATPIATTKDPAAATTTTTAVTGTSLPKTTLPPPTTTALITLDTSTVPGTTVEQSTSSVPQVTVTEASAVSTVPTSSDTPSSTGHATDAASTLSPQSSTALPNAGTPTAPQSEPMKTTVAPAESTTENPVPTAASTSTAPPFSTESSLAPQRMVVVAHGLIALRGRYINALNSGQRRSELVEAVKQDLATIFQILSHFLQLISLRSGSLIAEFAVVDLNNVSSGHDALSVQSSLRQAAQRKIGENQSAFAITRSFDELNDTQITDPLLLRFSVDDGNYLTESDVNGTTKIQSGTPEEQDGEEGENKAEAGSSLCGASLSCKLFFVAMALIAAMFLIVFFVILERILPCPGDEGRKKMEKKPRVKNPVEAI